VFKVRVVNKKGALFSKGQLHSLANFEKKTLQGAGSPTGGETKGALTLPTGFAGEKRRAAPFELARDIFLHPTRSREVETKNGILFLLVTRGTGAKNSSSGGLSHTPMGKGGFRARGGNQKWRGNSQKKKGKKKKKNRRGTPTPTKNPPKPLPTPGPFLRRFRGHGLSGFPTRTKSREVGAMNFVCLEWEKKTKLKVGMSESRKKPPPLLLGFCFVDSPGPSTLTRKKKISDAGAMRSAGEPAPTVWQPWKAKKPFRSNVLSRPVFRASKGGGQKHVTTIGKVLLTGKIFRSPFFPTGKRALGREQKIDWFPQ